MTSPCSKSNSGNTVGEKNDDPSSKGMQQVGTIGQPSKGCPCRVCQKRIRPRQTASALGKGELQSEASGSRSFAVAACHSRNHNSKELLSQPRTKPMQLSQNQGAEYSQSRSSLHALAASSRNNRPSTAKGSLTQNEHVRILLSTNHLSCSHAAVLRCTEIRGWNKNNQAQYSC